MAVQSNDTSSASWLSCTDRVAAQWQDFLILVGRVMFGWIFISSGWRKLMDIPAFVSSMPRRDLPAFLGYVAPPVEFVGGILLVIGFATRYTAVVMLVFLIIATFSSHRYWNYPEAQQANQSSHFWKNISMMGGNVLLFVTGAGRYALDRVMGR
jgi:putative oxidoreductase